MNNSEYFSSINDVSAQLNVPAHTLRYWEKQFPAAIRPTTGAGGRRYYRAETVARLTVIRDLLYSHGMTIAGVKKLIHDGNLPAAADDLMGARDAAPAQSAPVDTARDATRRTQINRAIEYLDAARHILAA